MQEALNELLVFSRQLSVISSLDVLAKEIAEGAVQILHATYSQVLMNLPGQTLACLAVYDKRPDHTSDPHQTTPLSTLHLYQRATLNNGPLFFRRETASLSTAERRRLGLNNGNSLCLAPMRLNTEPVGLLVLGQEDEHGDAMSLEEKRKLIAFLAEQAASALYRVSLSGRLRANQFETVLALAKALEAHDPHTAGHGRSMTELAEPIARQFRFSSPELETVRRAVLLHDIGKIGISDDILQKDGPLTAEEWILMKRHPQIGAEIVTNVSELAGVAELILAHHERFDGRGYPRGLVAEEIPLGARIIAVVDSYSAMTSGRVYRPACTHAEAIAELQRCSGTHFDPKVVEVFVTNFP